VAACAVRKSHAAGISAESYYCGSKQGRERQPSDQVLEGAWPAHYKLTHAARHRYMASMLARPAPRRRRTGCGFGEESRCWTTDLIDSWHPDPRICAGPVPDRPWSLIRWPAR